MAKKLTRRALDTWLKAVSGSQWLWCGELHGFGAQRRASATATFVVQYRVGHGRLAKRRRAVLGKYPTMPPEEAKVLAADYIRAGWKGCDPVAEKRAAQVLLCRQQDTFSALFDAFCRSRETRLRASSARLYKSKWKRLILPDFGSRPVSAIKRSEIASLLDRVETEVGASAADHVHGELRQFFGWFATRDDDFRSPLVRSMKRHTPGEGARPLTDDELRAFWSACGKAGHPGWAGRFCLLTASRRRETLGAQWSEISETGLWTIPASRYKTNRDHTIPLSDAALSVINEIERASPYLFGIADREPHAWKSWRTIIRAGAPDAPGLSWHSLRKTARTLMSRAGVRADHAERAMGHTQGAIERAYDKHNYLPEKRAAFIALAEEIKYVIDGRSTDNVVRILRNAAGPQSSHH